MAIEPGDLELILKKELGDSFETELSATLDRFNHLITREVAIQLMAKEKKLLPSEKRYELKDLSEAVKKGDKLSSIALSGTIRYFLPTKIINAKGKVLRYREVVISDDSEKISLGFWNENINVLANFSLGDSVEFKNVYVYSGRLTYGRSSAYRIASKAVPFNPNEHTLVENKHYMLQGTVVEIEPDYFYLRNEREQRMKSFRLSNGSSVVRIIAWDGISRVEKLQPSDIVRIEGALFRNNEFHMNSLSRLIKLKIVGENLVIGRIEGIEVGDSVLITVAQKQFSINRELISKLLNGNIQDDISTETLGELSKGILMGKKVALRQDDSSSSDISVRDIYLLG